MLGKDDRARCADALANATPEMLREDARRAIGSTRLCAVDADRERYLRHAALALAVAKMQERGAFLDGSGRFWDATFGDSLEQVDVTHESLPAALAALVRKEP